jgi:flagellar basal-body rod protein FlgF
MENPIYISLSRLMTLQRHMDVVANNVANASSTGYKRQGMLFTEFLKKPAPGEQLSLVQDRAVVRDLSQGPLQSTSNPLDVALQGKGYFVVDTLNGPHYTRAGRFQLDAKGTVVDANGLPVLTAGGQPITVPRGATQLRISGDGTVSAATSATAPAREVGKLNIVSFQKEQLMTEVGSGLYVTDEQPQPAGKDTKVTQGMLEESNVKPVAEITNMITILRQYQGIQKIADAEHDRQRNMIQKLGRQA